MMHPCKLFLGGGEPETFKAPAFLADRIKALSAGRPITTHPGRMAEDAFVGAAVLIRYADDAGGFLGCAVIGDPELDADMQDALLHGQLYNRQAA